MKDKFNNWVQKDPTKVIKIGVIAFIIFMIVSILGSIFLLSNFDSSDSKKNKNTTKENTKETSISYIKSGLKELSEEDSEKEYKSFIHLAEKGDWLNVSSSITKLREKYNLSEDYNQKIINLYLDASIMIQLESSKQESNIDAVTFSNIHDVNMKALGFLYLKSEVQAYIMNLGDYKLCPENINSTKILEIKDFEMTNPKDDIVIASLKIKEANKSNIVNPDGYKYSISDVEKIIRYKILANETEIYVYVIPRKSNTINIDSVTYVNQDDNVVLWHQSSYFLTEMIESNQSTVEETSEPISEINNNDISETTIIEETTKEPETTNIQETTKEKVISF